MSTITSNTANLTVTTPPPATVSSVLLTLDMNSVNVGQADNANISLFDNAGHSIATLPLNASIQYNALDPTIATILANGSAGDPLHSPITTLQVGTARFTATVTQN